MPHRDKHTVSPYSVILSRTGTVVLYMILCLRLILFELWNPIHTGYVHTAIKYGVTTKFELNCICYVMFEIKMTCFNIKCCDLLLYLQAFVKAFRLLRSGLTLFACLDRQYLLLLIVAHTCNIRAKPVSKSCFQYQTLTE